LPCAGFKQSLGNKSGLRPLLNNDAFQPKKKAHKLWPANERCVVADTCEQGIQLDGRPTELDRNGWSLVDPHQQAPASAFSITAHYYY
jgi:hypothetical protein